MAFSIVDLTGSDGQSNFSFSFPYLSQTHIHVYRDGVETFAFTFNNASTIHLTTPLSGAHTVRVQRLTLIDQPVVDYTNGSVLGETDLDTSTLQLLYSQQEIADISNDKIGKDATGNWDAQAKRITNMADATGTQDAVTKHQLDATFGASPGGHNIGAHLDSVSTTLAKGDILVVKDQGGAVLKYDKLPAGTNGQGLVPDTSSTSGLQWAHVGQVATVGGTVDAITLTPSPSIAAYVAGQEYWFIATGNNTVAPTVAVSGLAAKAITKHGAVALGAADIQTNMLVGIRYDGTRFQLLTEVCKNLDAAILTNATIGIIAGSIASGVTGVTQATGDSSTKLATTAFTQQEILADATNTHPRIPVRQTVLAGSVDANGAGNFLVSGTGLQIDYNATTTPVGIAHANGFDATGEVDVLTRLTANATNQFGTLPANITSFLQADKASASSITGGNTRIPPQYGEGYDQTQAALIHFDGTNGATSTTDDYGNTWTFAGNAVLDTAQKQFGVSSLKLDGTGDYAEWVPTLPAKFAQNGGWTIEGWVRYNVLPTAAQHMTIVNAGQSATTFGVLLTLFNNAGTTKLELSLSSNGTAADIVSLTVGTNTTWSINTQYHIAIVFDPLVGKYFVYLNGAQDISVTSAVPIAQVVKFRIGEQLDAAAVQHNGWFDELRISPCVRYPNGTAFTPAVAQFAVEGHFFSIPEMKMYEVTAASAVAGTNPTMTNRPTRIFLGDADAGAATITTTRTYAYRGRYVIPDTTYPGTVTRITFQSNLGVMPNGQSSPLLLRNYLADVGYTPGQVIELFVSVTTNMSPVFFAVAESRILHSFCYTGTPQFVHRTTGSATTLVLANWRIFGRIERGW